MERRGKRKEWVVPELLVLVRSHPEEAVLATCKIHPEVGSTLMAVAMGIHVPLARISHRADSRTLSRSGFRMYRDEPGMPLDKGRVVVKKLNTYIYIYIFKPLATFCPST
jgi:hypothetical protein